MMIDTNEIPAPLPGPALPGLPEHGPVLTRQRREQLRMLAEFSTPAGRRGVIAADTTCGEVMIPATWLTALLEG